MSISLPHHCPVTGKGRHGTEEAMESSGVSADDKVQRQWASRLAWKAFQVVKWLCKLQSAILWKLLLLLSS